MNSATNTGLRFRCLDADCEHVFRSESMPDGPEGCPECGSILFEDLTPPPARIAEALSVVAFAVAIRVDFSTECSECLGSGFLSESEECHALCLESGRVVAPLFVGEIHPHREFVPKAAQRQRAERAYLAVTQSPRDIAAPQHRSCITPPPRASAPPIPLLSHVDPDSKTWRAVRATSIETVRPGASI